RWLDRVPTGKRRGAPVLVAGRRRRAGAEVFSKGPRRRPPEEGRGRDGSLLAVALGARHRGAGATARERELCERTLGKAGVRSPRRLLDLLGLEGRLFLVRGRRLRLLRRAALHAGPDAGRPELAAMVQHRAALGLRRRWPRPGPLLRRLEDRQTHKI